MVYEMTPRTSPKPNDCGATCMQMLLSYYGEEVDLETLIAECSTGITGSSGKDLMDCGRKHGLEMKCYKMDAEELIRQDRPGIVWWMYRHWVVFGGVNDRGRVVIYNPDLGRYTVSKGVFESFYTGVSIWNGEPQDLPEENNE